MDVSPSKNHSDGVKVDGLTEELPKSPPVKVPGHSSNHVVSNSQKHDKHKSKHKEKEKHKHSSETHSKHRKSEKNGISSPHKSHHSNGEKRDVSPEKNKVLNNTEDSTKHKKSSKDQSSVKDKTNDNHKDEKHRKDGDKMKKEKHKHKNHDHKSSSSSSKHKEHSSSAKNDVKPHREKSPMKIEREEIKIKKDPDPAPVVNSSPVKLKIKTEQSSPVKRTMDSDSEDDLPLAARAKAKKVKTEPGSVTNKRKHKTEDDDFSDYKPVKKKTKQEVSPKKAKTPAETKKALKKKEEEKTVWKWWEEEKRADGVKWKSLEHKGPCFAPEYEVLPDSVKFLYDGKVMKLSPKAEEVATFFGKMLDHDYTTKPVFRENFFKDWRKEMTAEERKTISSLDKCDFRQMNTYFLQKSEERKNMTKEEKLVIKKTNEELLELYGWCMMDKHKQRIANFRIEPPGLFRGRGDHPKQGMLKRRVQPEDVIINCSKYCVTDPPPGHKWREVRCDNTVSWLASWTENVQNQNKYVMLNPTSKIKGEKDWQKYETARKLKGLVENIRKHYKEQWYSKEMRVRQRAVALYFIDKLALRAGNEKEEGETADTVGCCSLRVEHIKLHEECDGKEWVVEFDFLGKDSIRYHNFVAVEKKVFKNLQLFMDNKNPEDDLFDRLNTATLNKYLSELMDGLTAKVFRTYNASITLQEQLLKLINPKENVAEKVLSYNRANRAVAILCNHQRSAPKTFEKSMSNLQEKIEKKKETLAQDKKDVKSAKSDLKHANNEKNRQLVERKKKAVERTQEQLMKLEVQATDKEENKEIALGTSKLNYLDPRITVAWCKKFDVPLEKAYNKSQREKFAWAIDMADEEFEF